MRYSSYWHEIMILYYDSEENNHEGHMKGDNLNINSFYDFLNTSDIAWDCNWLTINDTLVN